MVIGIQNEILDSESRLLFSNEPFEKKPAMTSEDFVSCSDDHFESRLLWNGLYETLPLSDQNPLSLDAQPESSVSRRTAYRVAKTHRMPYLDRSFGAKEPHN